MGGHVSVDMNIRSSMWVRNMPFRIGQTLVVKGIPEDGARRFSLNILRSDEDIALHITPRFCYNQHEKKVAYNSKQKGNWGTELVGNNFPFKHGQEFTIKVEFKPTEFLVILSNGNFSFPNRLGEQEYSIFNFNGDAIIKSFDII